MQRLKFKNTNLGISLNKFKFVRPSLTPIIKLVIVMALLILVTSVLGLLTPYFTKQLFDKGIALKNTEQILRYGILILGTTFLALFLSFCSQWLFSLSSNRFSLSMKSRALQRMLNMPFEFFDKRQVGYLVSRVNEADSLNGLFSPSIFGFFASLVEGFGAIIILSKIKSSIVLILIPFLISFFIISRWMSKKLRTSSHALLENLAVSNGVMQETVTGVVDVKQLNLETQKSIEIQEQYLEIYNKRVKQSLFLNGGTSLLGMLQTGASITITIIAGIEITGGHLSMGDYFAISMYAVKIATPIQLFGNLTLMFQPIIASLKRLKLIFDSKTEQELWGNRKLNKIDGRIQFANTSFGYDIVKDNVLKDCSFLIEPGECVTLYGGNGSGKSTIFKLILGFYPNYLGRVEVDGFELHDCDISTLRQRIGIVSQNLFLFTGTLLENIKLAKPDARSDDIQRILILSGCMGIFEGDVVNTQVYDLGRNLSGGQRQAVAIARCMLQNPDIILFDEATAHLDSKTRQIVMNAIKNVFHNKTRVLITQEREIANIADRIFILDQGKVNEISRVEIP